MTSPSPGVNGAFVDWAAHCSRSEVMAAQLGLGLIRHYRRRTGIASTLGKYAVQFGRTVIDLGLARPKFVISMSPSPLTALPVWLYCCVSGASFVIDAHTGALLGPPWGRAPWLQLFFSRRARATLVTNEHLAGWIRRAGGRAVIVPDVPTEQVASAQPPTLPAGFNVVYAASFGRDEPMAVVLAAARRLPEVRFHITGRPSGVSASLVGRAPANVRFTGFLSRGSYLALVSAADVVLAMTTRNHTMQRSGYEAIYLGKPVVISDWPVLRENFAGAAVFTKNDEVALVQAIGQARGRIESLTAGARVLRGRKLARWEQTRRVLVELMRG